MTQLLLITWRFWTPRKTGCLHLQEPDLKSPATTIGQGDSGHSEEVPPQNLYALSIEDWVNEWNATSIWLLVPCVASQACYSVVWQFTWQNILKYSWKVSELPWFHREFITKTLSMDWLWKTLTGGFSMVCTFQSDAGFPKWIFLSNSGTSWAIKNMSK